MLEQKILISLYHIIYHMFIEFSLLTRNDRFMYDLFFDLFFKYKNLQRTTCYFYQSHLKKHYVSNIK